MTKHKIEWLNRPGHHLDGREHIAYPEVKK